MKWIASAVMASLCAVSLAQPSIRSLSQSNFKDVSFTWTIGQRNSAELAKINKDFAQSMRFSKSQVEMREPFMLRMESTVEGATVTFILNGTRKLATIPRTGLKHREDVAKAPGKRQTCFDFGILTPSLFNDYLDAKFVRTESRGTYSGDHVFDLTYDPSTKDTSRHRVWVDAGTKLVAKREWYGQDGRLKAIFEYQSPVQSNGVYMPSKLVVRSAGGAVAGVSTFSNIKANGGISTARFSVN